MDIVSSVATSRLVAQQRAMDVTAGNIANANTPGFKAERVLFSDWLSPPARHRCAAGRAHHRLYPGSRDLARAAGRHADPYRQSVRPRPSPATDIFTVSTPRGPRLTRDGRFGLMPRRNDGRQRRQRAARHQRPADPAVADRHADHHRRRRHGLQRERPARQDRRGAADRSDAAHGRRQHAVPRRCADRAGGLARPGAGRDRGFQRAAGAGDDADDGRPAAVPVRQPVHPGRGRPAAIGDRQAAAAAELEERIACVRSISPAPGCRRSRPTSK